MTIPSPRYVKINEPQHVCGMKNQENDVIWPVPCDEVFPNDF